MSNLTAFVLISISSLLTIGSFYFLVRKWSKFHTSIVGKILKVLYALLLLLAIIISLVFAFSSFDDYWQNDRIRVVTEFQGIRLGWSKDEVLFRKGEPESVAVTNDNQTWLDYGDTRIVLEKDIVVTIFYNCRQDDYIFERVGGISCSSDVNSIIEHYGNSTKVVVSEDKFSRIYHYPSYNLAFQLSKGVVEKLAVFDSSKTSELKLGEQVVARIPPKATPKTKLGAELDYDPFAEDVAKQPSSEKGSSEIDAEEKMKPWEKYQGDSSQKLREVDYDPFATPVSSEKGSSEVNAGQAEKQKKPE